MILVLACIGSFFVLKNMVRSQLKSHKHTWDCSWRNDMWTPTPWCRNQGILFGLKKWSSPNRMRIELQYNLCIPNSCVYVYNTWKNRASPTLKLLGLFVASCNASRMNGEFNNHHAVHQKHYSCQNMLLTHVETSITLQLNQLPNIINIVLKQS